MGKRDDIAFSKPQTNITMKYTRKKWCYVGEQWLGKRIIEVG